VERVAVQRFRTRIRELGVVVARGAGTQDRGCPSKNARLTRFASRQILDAASPANFLHTNPDLLERTRAESGQNLVRGFRHWLEDLERMLRGSRPVSAERFEIGKQVPSRPESSVRNRLIELHSVFCADAVRLRGADPDRAGVDHEILHPGSVGAEFPGAGTSWSMATLYL